MIPKSFILIFNAVLLFLQISSLCANGQSRLPGKGVKSSNAKQLADSFYLGTNINFFVSNQAIDKEEIAHYLLFDIGKHDGQSYWLQDYDSLESQASVYRSGNITNGWGNSFLIKRLYILCCLFEQKVISKNYSYLLDTKDKKVFLDLKIDNYLDSSGAQYSQVQRRFHKEIDSLFTEMRSRYSVSKKKGKQFFLTPNNIISQRFRWIDIPYYVVD